MILLPPTVHTQTFHNLIPHTLTRFQILASVQALNKSADTEDQLQQILYPSSLDHPAIMLG